MRDTKFRLIKDSKVVGYERFVYCNQREGYVKGKSLVPQHSKDGIHWEYIYLWEMKTKPKGYWFEAHIDMDVYIEHDEKESFTGLKDNDGKEIWEDDLYKAKDGLRRYVVTYSERFGHWYLKGIGEAWNVNTPNWWDGLYEKIGDIHSSPELLEK